MLPKLGESGLQPSGAGGFLRNAPRVWELPSRCRCFVTSSTVLTLFPSLFSPVPSFLLCYAFSSQRSLQSVAENDYKAPHSVKLYVIKCMFLLPFLSRPAPFQGQSTE
uniref:Uncharacterized protein n=2 Tax=Felidae TaxID=9681 RepID=A0A8C8WF17_PANLE